MKCPNCAGRELETTTDQVCFYKSTIVTDDNENLDVHDGKYLADGDWHIDPDAETVCRVCNHDGVASEFAEEQDKALIAGVLDFHLRRELESARKVRNR